MIWTELHANYLERQIRRMIQEEQTTDDAAAREVFYVCRQALIGLRRPTEPEKKWGSIMDLDRGKK